MLGGNVQVREPKMTAAEMARELTALVAAMEYAGLFIVPVFQGSRFGLGVLDVVKAPMETDSVNTEESPEALVAFKAFGPGSVQRVITAGLESLAREETP